MIRNCFTLLIFVSPIFLGCFLASVPLCASDHKQDHLPHIILITADDMGLHLGCYGDHTVGTPHLDRLAEEGVLFNRAYVTQASCSPSRSSIFTGLYPHQNGQIGLAHSGFSVHSGTPNLPTLLAQNGYRTGVIGKIHVEPESEFHFDFKRTKSLRDMQAITSMAEAFILDGEKQPFFLMINYFDPHKSWHGYGDARQVNGLPEDPLSGDQVKPFDYIGIETKEILEATAGYYNCVKRLDDGFGLLEELLRKHGLTDKTLVLFLGDHGPPFTRAKTTCYEAGVQIPFILRWPGHHPVGATRDELISTVDILPTLLEATGIELPDHLAGRSLMPMFRDEPVEWRQWLFTEYNAHGAEAFYPRRSVRSDRYKLILNTLHGKETPYGGIDGCPVWEASRQVGSEGSSIREIYDRYRVPPRIELYDLQKDPLEYRNLAHVPELALVKESLMTKLQQWREETGDPYLDPEKLELGVLVYRKPNILWLVAEDLSPYLSPFGDSTVLTPNLSRLAEEGVRYTNVFSVSGVCSPSRAALATGMYPTGIGAHHMRTLFQQPAAREKGIINYECVPPSYVKMVSEMMREQGYYCSNNSKEDYQFHPSKMAWDESSVYAHWRNRPFGQPFFSIFNFGVTHESNMWNPYGRPYDLEPFPPDRSNQTWWKVFQDMDKPLYVPEDLVVAIPPYLPATDAVTADMRRMYSNIVEMDRHVGVVLDQLKEDGLLESTIIVWYSDHGGPLPRQKRLLYDSGLEVPMIIRYPDRWREGEKDHRLISFVDFAPTLLSMAGIRPPEYMEGLAFEGRFKEMSDRKYIHAAGDRFDEYYDMIRAVRDQRFKYLRNFFPDKGYYLPLDYRENMSAMQELLRLRDAGLLDKVQMQWFRSSKPEEELFDTWNDPHELNNLAGDPAYGEKLAELRRECERWMEETGDMGFIPEEELIRQFWPDKIQPETSMPDVKIEKGAAEISCATEGASIGYKYPSDEKPGTGWRIYKDPLQLDPGDTLMVISHRIGYAPSDTVIVKK